MKEEIRISIIKNDDENILSFSSLIYPNYKKGDVLFLEKDILPTTPQRFVKNESPSFRLTKFIIKDVHHSVRQWFGENTEQNPFPFKIINKMSIEVYVKELERPLPKDKNGDGDILDTVDFYDMMQNYRHCPISEQEQTSRFYEEIKRFIRENKEKIQP